MSATATKKAQLLTVAIGPVQEFISAARKTRDLYAGSRLLSEASKHCAWFLKEQYQAELIFPFTANLERDLKPKSELIVANKVLACIGSELDAKAIAKACKEDLNRWLLTEFGKTYIAVDRKVTAFDRDLAERQLSGVLEFYAAWVEFERPHGYKAARRTVEQILAGRKNVRDFSKHIGSARPKSSLDGNRETVVEHKEKGEFERFTVQRNEFLDGLGVLKRFWGNPGRFDSTHDVAARPFLASLPAQRIQAYCEELGKLRDELPLSFSHVYHVDKDLKDTAAGEKVRAAVEVLKGGRQPQPGYYCVLVGDGDFMGAKIGDLEKIEDHQTFSNALSGFASAAVKALEKNGDAEPVFAGGDDVVAFLPLHRALPYMSAVRQEFQKAMKDFSGVSFSAGLVVCHALDPLKESLDSARAAEKAAKGVPLKDAFCVTVVPRSGSEASFKGKWDQDFDFLVEVANLYAEDKLTLSLAHEFRRLLGEWEGASAAAQLDVHLKDMALAIARKKDTSAAAIALIEKFFKESSATTDRERLSSLADCLYVARPFARAMREALPPEQRKKVVQG